MQKLTKTRKRMRLWFSKKTLIPHPLGATGSQKHWNQQIKNHILWAGRHALASNTNLIFIRPSSIPFWCIFKLLSNLFSSVQEINRSTLIVQCGFAYLHEPQRTKDNGLKFRLCSVQPGRSRAITGRETKAKASLQKLPANQIHGMLRIEGKALLITLRLALDTWLGLHHCINGVKHTFRMYLMARWQSMTRHNVLPLPFPFLPVFFFSHVT